MTTHYNKQEILSLIAEEAAELIQAASKIMRFGEDSYHPNDPEQVQNWRHFEQEMADLYETIYTLINHTETKISYKNLDVDRLAKADKIAKYITRFEKHGVGYYTVYSNPTSPFKRFPRSPQTEMHMSRDVDPLYNQPRPYCPCCDAIPPKPCGSILCVPKVTC